MRGSSLALVVATLTGTMCVMPQVARAQAEPFIAQIGTFAFNFCPNDGRRSTAS
jgi:hypothetical protein